MRTTDFSCAPAIGQATAQFVGATSFAGPRALVGLFRRWFPLERRLKQAPGYRGHRIWYRFPFTFGTIAFFSDRDALLRFARSPEHAEIMRWVMSPGNARGGFIRIWEVQPEGYSSGIWRAEPGNVLKGIDRFTPVGSEREGPPVLESPETREVRSHHPG
jgi:hypothetical protein